MNYDIICNVYETSNVYNSVILCSDEDARFLFEQMILDDFPVCGYERDMSQRMIDGSIRCVIVPNQSYEEFLHADWHVIKSLVTIVFYDKTFVDSLPSFESCSFIKLF